MWMLESWTQTFAMRNLASNYFSHFGSSTVLLRLVVEIQGPLMGLGLRRNQIPKKMDMGDNQRPLKSVGPTYACKQSPWGRGMQVCNREGKIPILPRLPILTPPAIALPFFFLAGVGVLVGLVVVVVVVRIVVEFMLNGVVVRIVVELMLDVVNVVEVGE